MIFRPITVIGRTDYNRAPCVVGAWAVLILILILIMLLIVFLILISVLILILFGYLP